LFFHRWYIYTNNSMFMLFFWGIVGPLGIRALCGTKEFHPDVICNRDTGIVS